MADDRGRVKPRSLRSRAIALLARREYARSELRQRLLARRANEAAHDAVHDEGARSAEVDALLDDLAREGYLSDARYAHSVVSRKAGQYSHRAIAQTLRRQGVAPETIDATIAGVETTDDEALRTLWERRFGCAPADDRARARQVRFLQSRGFALSAVLRLLRKVGRSA